MTNKKFKFAAMSMALTACVAAQPLLANAAETGSAPEASADLNLQNQNAAPEDSTGGAPDAAANAKALPPEAPANTEAAEKDQAPAFGPETDTDDVKIDYTESTTTGATTTETGDVLDTSRENEKTGEPGREIGKAEKSETELGSTTETTTSGTVTGSDVIDKNADGSTTITTPSITEETTMTTTTGTGDASAATDTDHTYTEDELKNITPEDVLGENYKDSLKWGTNTGSINGYEITGFTETGKNTGEMTLRKTTPPEGKKMSAEDIAKLLDLEKPDVAADGSYQLTRTEPIYDENGSQIGERTTVYRIIGTSVETTTTTTLTICMKKKELEGSEDVKTDTKIEGGNTNVDLKDEDITDPAPDVSVDLSELLTETDTRKVKEHRDANGALTGYTVTEGDKTYEITFDETSGKAVGDLSGLGPDQICDLLGRDKGYHAEDGKIFDKDGHELTVSEKQELLKTVKVTIKLTQTGSTDWTPADEDTAKKAEETAKAEAIFNALRDAIRKDEHLTPEEKAQLQAQLQSDQDAGKISSATKEWSYKDEDANRQYRYEYTVDNTTISTGDAADDATERKDTVNGTAYVSGSTIIRTGLHEEGPTITSGEVSGISSDFKTLPENVVEDSVEYIKIDGVQYLKKYTLQDGRTYEFTYTTDQKLPDDLRAGLGKGDVVSGDSFTMVSWTVTEEKQEDPEQADLSTGDKWDFDENSGTLTIKRANSPDETYEGLTYDAEKNAYKDSSGTLYTITETTTVANKEDVEKWLRANEAYKNAAVTSFNKETGIGTATYTDENNVEHTIRFTSSNRTLLITRSEMKTIINVDEAALRTEIRKELDSLEEGWQLKVGNQVVTRRNKELWLSDTEKATEKDIIRIINDAVHSFVDFKNMSRAELIQHLEAAKADADKAGLSYSESTSFDHADLDIETNLKDEKGNDLGKAFIIDRPTYTFGHSASTVVDGKATGPKLASNATYDDFSKKMEYRGTGYNYTANNYYSVTGKVAYGKDQSFNGRDAKNKADSRVKELGGDAIAVQTGSGTWTVFQHTADLLAYGYMDSDSNTCRNKPDPAAPSTQGHKGPGDHDKPGNGYDLLLKNLTLINGTVVAQSKTTYSATLTKSKCSTASGRLLEITGLSHIESSEGSGYFGSYDLTTTDHTDFTTTECGGKGVKGTGHGIFESIRSFFEKAFTGTTEGTRYDGTLNYTYTTDSDYTAAVVAKKDTYHTVANVSYQYTTTETRTSYRDDSTVVVVPPTTPDEAPQTPETPELQPAQDTVPDAPVLPLDIVVRPVQDAHALPQTGVNWWTAFCMAVSGFSLMAAGAFASLTGKNARH